MGKQAKPKAAHLKGVQRKHNPKTRWTNDNRRLPDLLWDPTILYDIVEEELQGGQSLTKFVPKKHEELVNRLHPPYDELLLNWETEIQHFAVDNQATIERTPLPGGGTKYSVYNEYADGARYFRKVLLVVETPRNQVSFKPKKQKEVKEKTNKSKE